MRAKATDSKKIPCRRINNYQKKLGKDPDKIIKWKTAVTRTVKGKCYKEMKLLLDKGADVNKLNLDGSTALMAAAGECDETSGHILINNRANISLTDPQGNTAYDIAVKKPCEKNVVSSVQLHWWQ